jgi:Thymidylate synthase
VHMFAQVSGLEPGELVHVIADCHIYDRHVEMVEKMIALEPFEAPKFTVDTDVKDFYAFTTKSFQMEHYQYHPFDERIPVAI